MGRAGRVASRPNDADYTGTTQRRESPLLGELWQFIAALDGARNTV